jgi:hypothetical protein
VTPPDIPAGADLRDAEQRLTAFLRRELEGSESEEVLAGEPPQVARSPANRIIVTVLRSLWQPAWRPALGAAAVLVLVLGGWWVWDTAHDPTGQRVLRGSGNETAAGPLQARANRLSDGRLRLSWRTVPEGDAYQVVIYGADLAEVARYYAGADSVLILDPGSLTAPTGDRQARFWRILVLHAGDEIAHSRLRGFDLVE